MVEGGHTTLMRCQRVMLVVEEEVVVVVGNLTPTSQGISLGACLKIWIMKTMEVDHLVGT